MSAPNLDGRRFRVTAGDGDFTDRTFFIFTQRDAIVWAPYAGGSIAHGHLLASVNPHGDLDARWHHVTVDGRLAAGGGRWILVRSGDDPVVYEGPFRIEEIGGNSEHR